MGGQRPDSRERQKSSLLLSGLMILLKLYIITITSSCVSLRLLRFQARGGSTKEALGMLEAQNWFAHISCTDGRFSSEVINYTAGSFIVLKILILVRLQASGCVHVVVLP